MTTTQLITGLRDIESGKIPTNCIIDMVPYLVAALQVGEQLTPELSNLLVAVESYGKRPDAIKHNFYTRLASKKYLTLMP